MSFTAAGTLSSNSVAGLTTLAHTNSAAGNVLILGTKVSSTTLAVSSVTGGGATGWVKIAGPQNDTGRVQELWMGTVTATGAQTITVTFSPTNSGLLTDLDVQEFASSLGAGAVWTKDVDGWLSNAASTTVTYPTLAPTGAAAELYVGQCRMPGGASFTGLTSGFTGQQDANGNPFIYNLAVTGSVSPTETNATNATSGTLAVLISDVAPPADSLSNTLEGVTPAGTTLTQGSGGNTGGASGDFFDAITMTGGAGATLASDSSLAAPRGALTLKCATGGTAAQSFAMWSTSLTTSGQVWFRVYCYTTSITPAANWRLLAFSTAAGTLCASIALTTTGLIRTADTGSLTVQTTVAAVPLNKWFRLEGYVTGSATAGQIEVRLYSDADAVVPTETITSGSAVNTAGPVGQFKIGQSGGTIASYGPVYFDEPTVNNTGYVGIAAGLLGLVGSPVLVRSTSGSITGQWGPGQNRTPGNLLIMLVSAAAVTSCTSISSQAGWVAIDNNGNSGTANARYRIQAVTATGGDAAPTVTTTLTGTGAMEMILLEVAGMGLSASGVISVLDTTASFLSGATAITLAAATFTATAAAPTFSREELAVAWFAQNRAAAALTFTDAGSGWTKLLGGNGVSSVLQSALLVKNPGTATSVATGAFSTNTTAFGTLCVATFKSARLAQQLAARRRVPRPYPRTSPAFR